MKYACLIIGSLLMTSSGTSMEPIRSVPQTQEQIVIKAASAEDPTVPTFKGLNPEFVSRPLTPAECQEWRDRLIQQNPDHTVEDLFTLRNWDVELYNRINLPVKIAVLENPELFSSKLGGHGLRFLDLPIYMPNQGWRIPPQLEQFKEMIGKAIAAERLLHPDFEKDCFVYITIDQGYVPPHTAQRRAGWHGDSYRKIDTKKKSITIPVDHVYVIADCCPTLFQAGPFSLEGIDPEDVDQVLARFTEVANDKPSITYPSYTLLRMDPYCVHDAGVNDSDQTIWRTFVKISVSQSRYCKLGNAHNQLFVYDWPMIPRHNVPYTSEAFKQSAHRKDRDRFQEVNVRQIDFLKSTSDLPWTDSKIHTIVRKNSVHAEKAKPGDILQTNLDGFLVTIMMAKENQWRVTSQDGYEVFMDELIFKNLYKADSVTEGVFLPKQEIRRAVEVTDDVRFYSTLGDLEYARKGNYIIYLNSDDIYTVPKKVFESKYRIIE